MHIHFWWACIDTSVPPVLGVDCSWGSQQPEKVHQGCSQWFMSRSQGWACWVRETKDLAAWWEAWGAGACTVLRPPAWETHTSLQFCVGWPVQAACSSCSVGSPHLSCAVPLSTSSQFSAVPSRALCCSGSLRASCSLFLIFAMAAVASLLLLITKRGHLLLFSYTRSGVVWWWEQNYWEVVGVLNLALYLAPGYYSLSTCFSSALESC